MQELNKRYRIKVTKLNELRYLSHLDWQSLIIKTFRRMGLKLAMSQGFNPTPRISLSPALPIFIESDCELVNFQTYEALDENFLEKFKKYSPNGIKIISFNEIKEDANEPKSLENYAQWAIYEAIVPEEKNHVYNFEKIRYIIEKCLSSDEILITKKTKKGIEKTINYRNSLKSIEIKDDGKLTFTLKVGQNDAIPSLRADEFIKILFEDASVFKIKRVEFLDTNLRVI